VNDQQRLAALEKMHREAPISSAATDLILRNAPGADEQSVKALHLAFMFGVSMSMQDPELASIVYHGYIDEIGPLGDFPAKGLREQIERYRAIELEITENGASGSGP
tara:strand:- start:2236 stop:2556 length:321 start_codon:yes stop_codon:yes gene_type:complete